jgi:hypothetical protein
VQADSETDEVYAQMTLQPVNKVCEHYFGKVISLLISSMEVKYFFLNATSMIETQCWHPNWA